MAMGQRPGSHGNHLIIALKGRNISTMAQSLAKAVTNYINNQKEHHRKMTFQEEVIRFLKEYGVEYDERYLWD